MSGTVSWSQLPGSWSSMPSAPTTATVVVIVDDGRIDVRDMRSGDQKTARDRDDAIALAEAIL